MEAVAQLKNDLPVAMTMAAFIGISWYICVELNIRLFFTFARYRGLYFWSCLLCSWGILTQPLAMLMTDFGIWTDHLVAVIVIYLSWLIMVVPQSFVLYSRLDLVVRNPRFLRRVLLSICATSFVFAVPTIVMGVFAQTNQGAYLTPTYMIWDKIQLTTFFVQETSLSVLYIIETYRRLRSSAIIHQDAQNRTVFHHLIWVNVLVIFLDCSLLALSYANFFYVQSAYKTCIYGVKLRVEFAILNRLVASVQRSSTSGYVNGAGYRSSPRSGHENNVRLNSISGQSTLSATEILRSGARAGQDSDPEIVHYHGAGIVQTTDVYQTSDLSAQVLDKPLAKENTQL